MSMLIKDESTQCLSIFHNTFSNTLLIERFVLTIYAVIFFIGLVGNIMTIVIIKYNTYLRTPTNFYLLNLAVSDLMMLLCNLPLEMIEIYYRQWPLPVAFCKLRSICAEFFTCSSILTILAFTCERYFAIVHPIHFHQLSHFRRARNIIVIIWCISLAFSLPLGLSYEIESVNVSSPTAMPTTSHYNSNRTRSTRVNDSYSQLSNYCNSCVPSKSVEKIWSIIMIIISLCFFYLPMLIIGAIYLFIGQALRRANTYENHIEEAEPSLSSISSNGMTLRRGLTSTPYQSNNIVTESIEMKPVTTHVGSYSWLKTRARYQARQVVVKTLVAVVIAFFFCYAPLYLQRLLSAIMGLSSKLTTESYIFSKIMGYLYVISGITFYFGSVINPLLYNVVSNKYRRAFRDLVCCRLTCKKKSNVQQKRKMFPRDRSNRQPVQYFITKTPQHPVQHNLTTNLCFDSSKQLNQRGQDMDWSQPRSIHYQANNHAALANSQSSRSNSSSAHSLQRENHPVRPSASLMSVSKAAHVPHRAKFSLRRKLFGQKQANNRVPWLTTKQMA